jgi:glucose/arabinose dehydrogenase
MNRLAVAAALLCAAPLAAQQQVPFRGDIPLAPQGLPVLPPPPEPVRMPTAEGQDIVVTTLVRGLSRPWSLAFVARDTLLITERTGKLRVVRGGKLDAQPVAGVPEVLVASLSGLMDIALHPDFARNGFVYLSYNKPLGETSSALAIARGRWDGKALAETRDVFVAGEGTGGVSRLAFGGDGMLYMSLAGGNEQRAQDPTSHAGKVLRLTDEGQVPSDNPFVGRSGYAPEIFTLGHRSTHGHAVHSLFCQVNHRSRPWSKTWSGLLHSFANSAPHPVPPRTVLSSRMAPTT